MQYVDTTKLKWLALIQKKYQQLYSKLAIAVLAPIGLVACGGSDDPVAAPLVQPQAVNWEVALTDSLGCGIEALHLTLDKAWVSIPRQEPSNQFEPTIPVEEDTEMVEWIELPLEEGMRINVANLRNGDVETLWSASLPAGNYYNLRVQFKSNDANNPLLNSVQYNGQPEQALELTSNEVLIPLNTNFSETTHKTLLDVDICQSVHRSAGGVATLTPQITQSDYVGIEQRSVQGKLSEAWSNTNVVALQNGNIVRTTKSESDGTFVLHHLPVGNIDLVFQHPNAGLATIKNIPVSSSAALALNNNEAFELPSQTNKTVALTLPAEASTALYYLRMSAVYSDGSTVDVPLVPLAKGTAVDWTSGLGKLWRVEYQTNGVIQWAQDENSVDGTYKIKANAYYTGNKLISLKEWTINLNDVNQVTLD